MYVKQRNVGNIHITSGDSGCCDDVTPVICKFAIVITDPVTTTSITIDGNLHTITWAVADGLGALVNKIHDAFVAEGYVTNTTNPHILAYNNEWVDTEIVVLVYTSADTVTMDSNPAATITKACIKTVACRYEGEVPYSATASFDLADAAVELADPANSPQTVAGSYNGGAGEGNTLGSDIEAAVQLLYAGEDNVVFKRVQIIEDVANSLYKYNLWLYGRREITSDDVLLVRCECEVDYTTEQV